MPEVSISQSANQSVSQYPCVAEVSAAILQFLRPPTEDDKGETGGTVIQLLNLGEFSYQLYVVFPNLIFFTI